MQPYTTDLPQRTQAGPAPDASHGESPAPLGTRPAYDDALDAAVEYTFPASDPIACVQSCCSAQDREHRPAAAP